MYLWLANAVCALPAAPPAATLFPHSEFEAMLVQVYRENPHLNAERTALKIADEHVAQANADFRPSIEANVAVGKQREKIADLDWNDGNAANGSLTVTQPLFTGFATVEGKRAAETRVLAARARLLVIEQGVLFTAIGDWLDLSEKETVLVLNEGNVSRLTHYRDATAKRFQAGDGTRTDVAQAESRLASAEADRARALADRDSADATYRRDTGLVPQLGPWPPIPADLPATRDQAELEAKSNPALTQAEQEQAAAAHDIEVAEASIWPKIYLQGSISRENSPALGLDRLQDESLTINMAIPLYQGGGEYSRVREAKLARQKSEQDALDTRRDVTERAALSWNNFIAARTVIDASARALEAADRALDGVQQEQRAGLRTLTEVLDQQSERLSTQVAHVEAEKNARLEAYRLLAATGQLTAEGLRLPVQTYDPVEHHDEVKGKWFGLE